MQALYDSGTSCENGFKIRYWTEGEVSNEKSNNNLQGVSNMYTAIPTIGIDCRKLYITFSFFLLTDFVTYTNTCNTYVTSN